MLSPRQMDKQSGSVYATNDPRFRRAGADEFIYFHSLNDAYNRSGHEALTAAQPTPRELVKQCDACKIQNRTVRICKSMNVNCLLTFFLSVDGGRYNRTMSTICSYCADLRRTMHILQRGSAPGEFLCQLLYGSSMISKACGVMGPLSIIEEGIPDNSWQLKVSSRTRVSLCVFSLCH